MASVIKYETKKGTRWMYKTYSSINPKTGKRQGITKRGFLTKKEAKFASAEFEKSVADGTYQADMNLSFEEVFSEWFAMKAKKTKPSTQDVVRSKFSKHILPAFVKMKIPKVSRKFCQDFFDTLTNVLSNKTVNDYKMYVNQVFRFAIQHEYIKKNPMEFVVVQVEQSKFLEEEKNKKMFLEKDEALLLLKTLKENYSQKEHLLFHLYIYTGARKGEILALKWTDINFANSTMSLSKTLFFKDKEYIIQTPKSRKSRRIISLDNTTLKLLSEWRINEEKEIAIPTLDTDYIFKRLDGRPLRVVQPNDWLRKVIREHSLPKIKVHDLRHTHASLLFESGVSIKEVQERLGHSDITMTMNIYTHVSKRAVENTATKFHNFLSE